MMFVRFQWKSPSWEGEQSWAKSLKGKFLVFNGKEHPQKSHSDFAKCVSNFAGQIISEEDNFKNCVNCLQLLTINLLHTFYFGSQKTLLVI